MKIIKSLLLLSAIVFFASCTEEDPPTVQLTFEHLANGTPIESGSLHQVGEVEELVEDENGTFVVQTSEKLVTFSTVQFYIHNLKMVKTDGEEFEINGTHYIDLDNTSIDLGKIDADSYTAIKFDVGVDSMNNHLDIALLPESDPLSYKSPSMHWSWQAGYRFISLNGYYDGDDDGMVAATDSLLELHIGNDAYLREATVSYALEAVEEENYDLTIKVDYADLFNYDITDFPIVKTAMINERNTKIADAIPSIFSR